MCSGGRAATVAASAEDLTQTVSSFCSCTTGRWSTGTAVLALRPLSFGAPLQWLALGWQDFKRAPAIGLFYGASFMAMGWALLGVFQHAPAYTLALSAGFLLMGPFMCLGLYDVSLQLERGLKPNLIDSMGAWASRTATLGIFGFVLLVLEMLWARASLIVFAVSFDGMPNFTLATLLDPENISFFVVYLTVGGIFAGLIFAVSVVSIPMILDRQTDAITAGLTSLRLCLTQPGLMIFWGALITVLVVLAMAPGFAGLMVVALELGHASWHAYRAAVGT